MLLIDKNILLPRDRLTYRVKRDGSSGKSGMITGSEVKCTCCNKTFTIEDFVAHASGENRSHHPWSLLFLKDKRSLEQCLVQLMNRENFVTNASMHVKQKRKCIDRDEDTICSICFDGGELLICNKCPAMFHLDCLGLQGAPQGD